MKELAEKGTKFGVELLLRNAAFVFDVVHEVRRARGGAVVEGENFGPLCYVREL